jgi:lipopolysaccharide transport system permease protein
VKQRRLDLVLQLARREIESRYRGSMLGVLWSVVTPLFMLVVFTFVFSVIFQARWTVPAAGSGAAPATDSIGFAIILFAGLIVFNLFSDVISRASTLIVNQRSLVKRVIFPLELLPVSILLAALVQTVIAFGILIAALLFSGAGLHWTILLLPVVLIPACLIILGLAWFLAALGVYLRDVQHIVPPAITAVMFLTPVFYPPEALPEQLRWLAWINPLAYAVQDVRLVTVFGTLPPLSHWLAGFGIGFAIAALGYVFFMKTRKGFADVL